MFGKEERYAVVGASRERSKYGNKVLRHLKGEGFDVVAVNPHASEIEGVPCFPNLKKAGEVDVVVFVVPPKITERILSEAKKLGIRKVWMQPGSESEKSIEFCRENGMECVHGACIIMDGP